MLQTLLLNSTYECISFITERKVFKLIAKDKVEVLHYWDEEFHWGRGSSKHPSVIRLKHHVRWIPQKMRFKRAGVFRRDQFICQYCGIALTPSKVTVDHVLPRSQGGDSSWKNCVTSCFECNNRKGDRTPEQAKMKLLNKPVVPVVSIATEYNLLKKKHDDWKLYIVQPK